MQFKGIKAIIFDFGFTLYYFKDATVEKYMNCYKQGLQKCIQKLFDMEILKNSSEKRQFKQIFNKKRMESFKLSRKTTQEFPTTEIIKEIFNIMNKKVDNEVSEELATLYHSCEEDEWVPFKNTEKTLKQLKKLNIKLALLSNHPHHQTIETLINKHNLSKYFEVIITSGDYGKRKPNPDIFLYTIEKMGFNEKDAAHILVCGDEYADIMGAHRVGLQKIFFQRTVEFPFEKEIPIDDFEKINEISKILQYI
ncbi:MAG: HAD family hydrolase [Promethearchaeota archaeon]|nr:MAG: HAD family hydrolase [Candidatus Lokiarchaeota archaeon]